MSAQVSSKADGGICEMKKNISGMVTVAAALVVASMVFVGCSNNDTVNSSSGGLDSNMGAMNYFPVDVGYSASFIVTDANGVEIRRESYSADSAVFINGHRGVNWVQRDLSDSSVMSRGAMHWNSDRSILFHTADSSRNNERLLRLPFAERAAWPRWREPNSGGGGNTGGGSGGGQSGGDTGNNGGTNDGSNGAGLGNGIGDNSNPLLTSYPTQGMPTFQIASLSADVTINGKLYPDCLLVVNVNSDNTANRYWYCQGVGLVKYALNVTFGESQGMVNGTIMQ